MYGILVAAVNFLLGWLVRGVVVKFIVLTGLYYVVTWIAESVLTRLDVSPLTGLQSLLDTIPSSLMYFMGVLRFDVGLPLILGAMLTAFIIRRLPIIG